MQVNGHDLVIDRATKFENFLLIVGFIKPARTKLREISLPMIDGIIAQKTSVGLENEGVLASLGSGVGFELQLFLKEPFNFESEFPIMFEFLDGETFQVNLSTLIEDRLARYPSYAISKEFNDTIRSHEGAKVLDLGGRDRSKVDRSQFFPDVDYTVLDIIPGENVDVVGDAHNLSRYFGENSFDYIVSISVFEHLSMPWKVALEMNKVLKIGGKAMILTHQSIGLHDFPWDFFRFSDSAWDGIFNSKTGFKILHRILDHENFILPFLIRPIMLDAEKSAGFEVSLVIVEKVSECSLEWGVEQAEILATSYPTLEMETVPIYE
jgi:hypothetical protein